MWPDKEVILGIFDEKVETDPDSSSDNNECYNMTFTFIPVYQFRYAPGDGNWDNKKNSLNDINSWNFEITVTDRGELTSTPKSKSVTDEFGVNSYAEVLSPGIVSIQGFPGQKSSSNSNISFNTC